MVVRKKYWLVMDWGLMELYEKLPTGFKTMRSRLW